MSQNLIERFGASSMKKQHASMIACALASAHLDAAALFVPRPGTDNPSGGARDGDAEALV